jgi:hypothetical protein
LADFMSILSANYKTVGSVVPSKTPYVAVDPTIYQGSWSGTYANKKPFTITVSQISGFRAQVRYQSNGTVKNQSVLIKDGSFRVGDTKFFLATAAVPATPATAETAATPAKAATATIKNVVIDPATGSTFLDTATATQSK